MDGEEDQYNGLSQESTAGGIGDDYSEENDPRMQRLAKERAANDELYNQAHAVGHEAAQSAYGGANAAQRWAGTPAIGLSIFKKREPIYGVQFDRKTHEPIYTQRIDASTHMASPPSGLIGGKALEYQMAGFKDRGMGSALTPESSWRKLFLIPETPVQTEIARRIKTGEGLFSSKDMSQMQTGYA